MEKLDSQEFQVLGTDDDVALPPVNDPWLATYVLTVEQVQQMIAESEARMSAKVRAELEGVEFRLQSQINEEIIKRRYLKTLVIQYAEQFRTLRRFLTP